MIDRPELTNRIATATRWVTLIDGRVDGTNDQLAQVHRAALDLRHIDSNRIITAAWNRIHDHLPGYPATSMPARGAKGSTSNRTLHLAIPENDRIDPVRRDVDELLELLTRIRSDAETIASHRSCLGVRSSKVENGRELPVATVLEGDARRLRFLLLRWAKEPDARWCTSCERNAGHHQPIDSSRYGDVCRWCGEFRATNKKLPPIEILRARHSGQRLSQQLLDRHHVKLPKRKKATT